MGRSSWYKKVCSVGAVYGESQMTRWAWLTLALLGVSFPFVAPLGAQPASSPRTGTADALLQDGANASLATQTANAAPDAAASGDNNGTNPADTAKTFVLRNEYLELGNGTVLNTLAARVNLPIFGGRAKLGVEVPFNYIDARRAEVGPIGGLGDLKLGLSAPLWQSDSKKLTFVSGADFWLPTADSVLLSRRPDTNTFTFQDIGTGKFRAGPFAALVYAFDPSFFFAPVYQHEFSFAGDRSRATIHRGVVKLFLSKAFTSGLYVLPEAQILVDFQNDNDLDVFLAPEVGYSRKGTTVFFKPGFGINADANNRQVGVSFGVRSSF
jgi:hypothetical protein